MRSTYLVCYDICNDKRLRKVFQVVRGYGDHLQYSVFECHGSWRNGAITMACGAAKESIVTG